MKTFRNRKFIYFTFRKDLEKFFFLFSSAFQHFPALSVFLASASQSRSLERVKAIFAEKSSRSHFTSRTSLREVESSLRRFSAFFFSWHSTVCPPTTNYPRISIHFTKKRRARPRIEDKRGLRGRECTRIRRAETRK